MSPFKKLPTDYKFGADEHLVGLFVSKRDASHVGIVYLNLNEKGEVTDPPVKALHLSGDLRLLDEKLDLAGSKNYLLAPTQLSVDVAINFCAFLNLASKNSNSIHFGINWIGSRGAFKKDGTYLPPADPEMEGLTCATLVSELFEAMALHVVDESKWPANEDFNKIWRDKTVAALRANKDIDPKIADRAEKAENVVRLHPAEMASAGVKNRSQWPLTQAAIDGDAKQLMKDFSIAFPPKS